MSDFEEIRRTLLLLRAGDEVVELRVPKTHTNDGVVSGYFDNIEALARAAHTEDGIARGAGVYVTLNPVTPDLLARSKNRVKPWVKRTTKDEEVIRRRWLPIDIDPVRPAGISASDTEQEAALGRMVEIENLLSKRGWPTPLSALSGNGWHLLYRIDLPNDNAAAKLLQAVLTALAALFNDETAVVDEATYNAARLVRVYGTLARKGDATPDRPHRRSRIVDPSGGREGVPLARLEELAALAPGLHPSGHPKFNTAGFDVEHWIESRGLEIQGPFPWNGSGRVWRFKQCPWNPEHGAGSAFIAQLPHGALAAGCHHASCSDKNWHSLRDLLEPGWRATERKQTEPIDPPPSEIAVDPFPVDVLPAPLRLYVEESAQAIGVPAEFIAVPLLSALGVAVGTTRRLELKPGWQELPTLWTAIVAEPGSAKSPALQQALAGVFEHQTKLQEDFRRDWAQHKAKTGQQPEQTEKGQDGDPPVRKQAFTSDSTTEALADVLLENPRGLLFYQDELAGWARGFNQYKGTGGADRQTWSSFWNSAPVMINRRNRPEPLHLEQPFVCVAGAIPPDVLSELNDERGREDGFLSRILFAFPETQAARWTDAAPAQSTVAGYKKVFEELFSLRPRISLLPGQKHFVCLTERGKARWIQFYDEHVDEMNAPDFPYPLRAPWAKLKGYCARFALILQMARVGSDEVESEDVDEVSIRGAVRLVDYFKSQGRKVYASLHSTYEDKQLARAIEFLRKRGGSASVREFVTAKVAGSQTSRDAQELFDKLEDAGWGAINSVTPPKGGRPSTIFRLNSATEPTWSGD